MLTKQIIRPSSSPWSAPAIFVAKNSHYSHYRHYEFNRLPFGLSNSPANFQQLMDAVLKDLVGTECWLFINDIIVYSTSAEEHAARLENVLRRFVETNLQLHPGKCVFTQPQVQYLRFIPSENGVTASPDKMKAVKQYPTPKCVKDVRAYLGLASFYRG